MTDLTKITTPYGLLDEKTREALQAHGGPYQFWSGSEWIEASPDWCPEFAYRVKPRPPMPREFWGYLYSSGEQGQVYNEEEWARQRANGAKLIHVREVIEE